MNEAEDRLAPLIDLAFDETVTQAKASGLFDRINQFEPKSSPGTGLTFAVWTQLILPIPLRSGLNVTSARLMLQGRIYMPFIAEAPDLIDPKATKAASYIIAQFTANFQVNPSMWVDLEGAYGPPLGSKAGYINLDGKMFRILDLDIPFVAEDVYNQEG
jgi:hypothetical protein